MSGLGRSIRYNRSYLDKNNVQKYSSSRMALGRQQGSLLSNKQKVEVKRLIKNQVPTKFIDTASGSANVSIPVSTLAPLMQCNIISQGLVEGDRTGDMIHYRSLMIRFHGYTASTTDNTVSRLIVFKWHPSTELSVPTLTQILQNLGTFSDDLIMDTGYNVDNKAQFTILLDRIFTWPTSGSKESQFFTKTFYSKKLGICRYFNGSSSECTNGIFIYHIGSNGTLADNPDCTMYTRLTYSD